jgi:hypothetical protein
MEHLLEQFGNDMSRVVAFSRGQQDFRRGKYNCRYQEPQLQRDYRDGYHNYAHVM